MIRDDHLEELTNFMDNILFLKKIKRVAFKIVNKILAKFNLSDSFFFGILWNIILLCVFETVSSCSSGWLWTHKTTVAVYQI